MANLNTTFTGTNGAALPSPWTTISGTASIQTNRAQQTTAAATWSSAESRANQTWTDGRVDANLRFTAATNRSQRINVRWNPATGNGYRIICTPEYSGFQLMRVTNFQETAIQEVFNTTWAANTDYIVAIEFTGTTVRAKRWLANASEPTTWTVTGTDATYTSGDVSIVTTSTGTAAAATGLWTSVNVTDNGGGVVEPPPATGTYTASTAIIPNQERGWFHYTETHYLSNNTGHSALSTSDLSAARANGRTVVFRYYVIEKYLNVDTIDQAYKDLLTADFNAARAAGVKLLVRFTYSTSGVMTPPYNADPPRARVVSHIQQLAPVLNAHDDVIYAIQTGFIGMWGEWYYTDNFGDVGNVTTAQWADRKAVVDALMTNLDPSIFVLVRYVNVMRRFIDGDPTNVNYNTRMGHHNDAFLAEAQDWGTYGEFAWNGYTPDQNRTWLINRNSTGNFPQGGETAGVNSPRSLYPSAKTEMSTYGWTFLNPNYHMDVLNSWTQADRDEVARLIGYRVRMVDATVPTTATPGGNMAITLIVNNDGWAAPNNSKPVRIVFTNGTNTYTRALATDFRTWRIGQKTITETVVAPAVAGTYSTYLEIVDANPTLQSNPLYSVQLANTSMWDAATGRNNLNRTVTVSGSNPPAGTKIGTIVASFDADWGLFTNRSANPTLVGGRARIPVNTGYDSIETAKTYSMKETSVYARLYPAAVSGATGEASIIFAVNSPTAGDRLVVARIDTFNNTIRFSSEAAYFDAGAVSLTYDPTAHAWVRLRETGGNLFWDTSPDAVTWTQRRTVASPSWVTTTGDSSVQFVTHRDAGTANFAEVDNVNMVPAVTMINGVRMGSGTVSLRVGTGAVTAAYMGTTKVWP